MQDQLALGETKRYVLHALAGQTMRVLVSPHWIEFGITGADSAVLRRRELPYYWRGELPTTQDYFIELAIAEGHSESQDVALSVLINPVGQTTQWFTYRDEDAGFQIRYSDYFAPGTAYPFLLMTGQPLFSLTFVGTEFFEGTNLLDGSLYFGASKDPAIFSICAAARGSEVPGGEHIINGVKYSISQAREGAAGTTYEQVLYRGVQGDTCYEMGFLIAYVNIGNYGPDSGITEFNREGVLDKLREVLQTFQPIES